MKSTKLIEFFDTFSAKDHKRFLKFIRSPLYNENSILINLYKVIEQSYYPQEKTAISKEFVWSQIYPNTKYNIQFFTGLCSELLKLVRDYLALDIYMDNPINKQNNLLMSLNDRKLNKYFDNSMKIAQKSQAQAKIRNAYFYFKQYQIEREYNNHLEKRLERSNEVNIKKTIDNLDAFYLINKLKYYCEILNYKNVVALDYDILFIDEIVQHVKSNNYDHIPAIMIYFNILITLTDSRNEAYYFDLKNLLTLHASKFDHDEARVMYGFAQNYCIKKVNTGVPKFLNELFELYQIVLDTKVIFTQEILSPWDYKNIVAIGLRLNENTWVEDFIKSYKGKIATEYRDNAYIYNMAKLHFHNKNFSHVIKLLQKVEYKDVFYGLDSRATLLKTYYEADEITALYSLIDSSRIFLRRNKLISDNHRRNYLNFINYLKKLTKLLPDDQAKLARMKSEIKNVKDIADINWLLEKIGELEHKRAIAV
ncbi:MAG: hypothetical protein COA57_14585 [Flavobacteriales bacterium]|nr:hypothetical protein [Bacteroidia bacterium]PCJ81137.1 MAG: hypothetical protein COA57_14585 [Flavobacteriales bacterium]